MQFDAQRILAIVLKELAEQEKNKSIIYWDDKLLEAGETIKAGNQLIQMPFQGYLAFIDLEPTANWGHPAYYFLINVETSDVKRIDREFPPYSGTYPPSFKVILRYGKNPPHDRYFKIFDE